MHFLKQSKFVTTVKTITATEKSIAWIRSASFQSLWRRAAVVLMESTMMAMVK
jgi:hypothetical protein